MKLQIGDRGNRFHVHPALLKFFFEKPEMM